MVRRVGVLRGWHGIGTIAVCIVLILSVLALGNWIQASIATWQGSNPGSIVPAASYAIGCPLTPGFAAYFVGPIPATFTLSPELSLSGHGSIYVGVGVLGGTATITVKDSLGNTFTEITSYKSSWDDEGAIFYHDYSAAESGLKITVVFSGGGNHAVAIAIPITGTYQTPSLNAIGSWVSATSATSVTASVTTPEPGDTILMFPFDTVGASSERGLPTPNVVFANVPNGGYSTYADLWEGNDSYGYDAGSGPMTVTQSGGASGGSIFAIAVGLQPTSTQSNPGCPMYPGPSTGAVGPIPATFSLGGLTLNPGGAVYLAVGVLGGTANILVTDNYGNTFTHITYFNASWGDEGALFYHVYSGGAPELTISVTFSGGTGTHAVAIAVPVTETNNIAPVLDAVGSWVSAESSSSVTATVNPPNAGDTILMFPFDTAGVGTEEGLPTPTDGFGSIVFAAYSTYAELWEGNDSYGVDATAGSMTITQGGGEPNGDIFAIAIALRPVSTVGQCNPLYQPVAIADVDVIANPTNVTVAWIEVPNLIGATTYLNWGNTTSYGYTQTISYQYPYSEFLDFLEPQTTYYFEIEVVPPAQSSCSVVYTTGWYTGGQWTTGSDSMTTFQGTVQGLGSNNQPNGLYAPYNLELRAICDAEPSLIDYGTVNNLAGVYQINVDNWFGMGYSTCEGISVEVLNYPGDGYASWNGYWNETVVTWAPQVVNFVLPMNYLTGYTPGILDFSNAPSTAGYTSIEYEQSVGFQNTYTYTWSAGAQVTGIGGGASGSTQSGTGVTAQTGWVADYGSLCVVFQYEVTGTVQFTAMSRAWAFSQTLFDAQNGEFCNQAGYTVPTDWFNNETSASNDIYYLEGPANSKWANGLHNVPLWQGDSFPYAVTVSSSESSMTGIDMDFALSGALAGALPLSFQASEGWSQTVTTTSSVELSYDIVGPSSSTVSCYNVFGEGGSQSANTADMVAIYYWTGFVTNDVPGCT